MVFAESSLGWGAYELELADHEFERQRLHQEPGEVRPSELFRRQCYLTGCFDRAGVDLRSYIGLDNILWETNFPQASSPWPRSWDAIDSSFSNVPERERPSESDNGRPFRARAAGSNVRPPPHQ